MKLTKLLPIKEKKNVVGKVPSINLTIHLDSTYDKDTKIVNVNITNQSGKAVNFEIPEVGSEQEVQQIVSGMESEILMASKDFSKRLSKILEKYQSRA